MIRFLWAEVHINAWRQKIKEMNDDKIYLLGLDIFGII